MANQKNFDQLLQKSNKENLKRQIDVEKRQEKRDETLITDQKRTADALESMLDGMALDRQRSQDKTEKPTGKSSDNRQAPIKGEDYSGGALFGISQILMGIAGAVTGLAVGIVSGFVKAIAFLGGKIARLLLPERFKPILKSIGKAIGSFIKTIKNIPAFFVNMGRSLTAGFKGLKTMNSAITGAFVSTQKGLTGINKFFFNLGESLKKLSISKVGLKVQRGINGFKRVFKPIGEVFSSIGKSFSGIGNRVKSIGQGASKIGKIFKFLGSTFGKMFGVFKTIGSKIAFPIAILMSIYDGVTGFFDGFQKYKDKGFVAGILGGLMGGVKKVIGNLVMVPLDLLKSGVSWIAGKLGFTQFEKMLDNFSFKKLFDNIIDAFTDGIFGLGDWFADKFRKADAKIIDGAKIVSKFFGDIGRGIGAFFSNMGKGIVNKFKDTKSFMKPLFDGLSNIKQKIKEFFMSLLPDPNSLAAAIIPDSVYEWGGVAVPPKEEKYSKKQERNNRRGGSEEQGEEPLFEFSDPVMQERMDEMMRLSEEAKESGDRSKLEAFFSDDQAIREKEEKVLRNLQNLKDFESKKLTESEYDYTVNEMLMPSSYGDTYVDGKRQFTNVDVNRDQDGNLKTMADLSDKQLEKLQWMRNDIDQDESSLRELIGTLNTELVETYNKRESIDGKPLENKLEVKLPERTGSRLSEEQMKQADLKRQQLAEAQKASMIVAPSTNVVNNNSSQGIIMNQNMPAVDPLDQAYGV
jgi:hypothetical protein